MNVLLPTPVLVAVLEVAPEAVHKMVPFRYFEKVAEVEASRLPPLPEVVRMLTEAGFARIREETVVRNRKLALQEVVDSLRKRSRPSYKLLSKDELEKGIEEIKKQAEQARGNWIEARAAVFVVGERRC